MSTPCFHMNGLDYHRTEGGKLEDLLNDRIGRGSFIRDFAQLDVVALERTKKYWYCLNGWIVGYGKVKNDTLQRRRNEKCKAVDCRRNAHYKPQENSPQTRTDRRGVPKIGDGG